MYNYVQLRILPVEHWRACIHTEVHPEFTGQMLTCNYKDDGVITEDDSTFAINLDVSFCHYTKEYSTFTTIISSITRDLQAKLSLL